MKIECPFLFYRSEENQDYLVSAPIHAITTFKKRTGFLLNMVLKRSII